MRDGREWRLGEATDVAWIKDATNIGMTITAAIPPVFEAYGTSVIPEWDDRQGAARQDQALLATLSDAAGSLAWWLGYLDTGVDDIVFADAPKVELYARWRYVLVLAGPAQAGSWRSRDWRGPLPDLMFPADRSWLVSRLWDDDWRCIGGSATLLDKLHAHPDIRARTLTLTEIATPPGHSAI
jgi:hypothetical protein